MRPDRVLFAGSVYWSHPVLDRMFAGSLEPEANPQLGDHHLVVVDARLGGDSLSEEGIVQRALQAGVAVLVIAPAAGQLSSLTLLGVRPGMPAQAVFILPGRSEPRQYHVRVLGYPVTPDPTGPTVLADFATSVERGVEHGFVAPRADFPDGLKWSYAVWDYVQPFTIATTGSKSDENFTNGAGSLTMSCELWSFLSIYRGVTTTYVVMQDTQTMNPGSLASNDQEARAVVTLWLESGWAPQPTTFIHNDHIPQSGTDNWDESFEITIHYVDPFGAEQAYLYTARVVQSITSWSVTNASAGLMQGSTWYVNSPVDGMRFPEDRHQAFTGSGHVEPFPTASTQTLSVKEASAWKAGGEYSGALRFDLLQRVRSASIYGTNCGKLFCYDPESRQVITKVEGWFDIDVHF
jgi:hypothetical protein